MMLHSYLADAKFWVVLLRFDEDLAAEVRSRGCPHCGGVLHGARYPRKPRGAVRSALGSAYEHRLSLCCAREGCRRRTTPPSVRFLGRRVYLGVLVVLVSALAQEGSARRQRVLHRRFGVGPRTLGRWQRWWREVFPASRFWREARGAFVPAPGALDLPRALLERVGCGDRVQRLIATLHFLAPVTVS